MSELSKDGKAALQYWGVIQKAVEMKATTSELWQAIRESAEMQGLDHPGVSLLGVNELRSRAAGTRNADTRFASAEPGTALQSDHISVAPWSRDQQDRNLNPMLQIRFEHHTIVDGVLQTDWRTVVHSGQLPESVDDLYELVDHSGEQLAADYESGHAGIGKISIMSV